MIKAKELPNFSSYQMLIMDKNWQSYQSAMKLVKYLALIMLTMAATLPNLFLVDNMGGCRNSFFVFVSDRSRSRLTKSENLDLFS